MIERKNPIVINPDLCIGCGACVKDCVGEHLYMSGGKARVKDGGCIKCGHCFAVCPKNAVEMPGCDVSDCRKPVSMDVFDSDSFLHAMKSRRSVRQFKSVPVEKEKIDKIIESGRFCPTATNSQDIHYTVITESLDEIQADAVGFFRTIQKGASPLVKYISNMTIADDFFFRGAPLVIVVSGKSKTNACLASSYMELMAANLGLGAFYSGFFVAVSKFSGKVKKRLNIPKDFTPYTCLIIGYPDVSYKRIPPRRKANVSYL